MSREITFSSEEEIQAFELVQKISMNGQEIEQLKFRFGFVIPKSTNTWQQTIQADAENMLPHEMLSGNLLVETLFLCEKGIVHRSYYRVFYD